MQPRFELVLSGCSPTPLAGYLKALAVLRLVSEQVDGQAQGWWEDESFHLRSSLDVTALVEFLAEKYEPTPILAPWNGGSGFYPKDSRGAIEALGASPADRFRAYRTAIHSTMALVHEMGLEERPKEDAKAEFFAACRNRLSDEVVEWLDAAVVLTTSGLRFPPLLGTGGNDGRLEFTNNFMQRLIDVIEPTTGVPTALSRDWMRAALFGGSVAGLMGAAVGQFSPGAAGGPNSRAGYDGGSLVNPWDFVLMMEGALVFAAAATKRLETRRTAVLSYPFTVYPSGVGHGSVTDADEADSRAEMWLPLWRRPWTHREMAHVFREGRVQVNGRPARDAVDFARACATLAVDRGIGSFQRYSFLQRSGKSYLAVPLTRFRVERRPEAELLNDLDRSRWMDALRVFVKGGAPQSFVSAHRSIREAVFQLCLHGGRERVQSVLVALGRAERLVARNLAARLAIPPLVLRSSEWLSKADDASHEFALAAAIAGWYSPGLPAIRAYFSPVKVGHPAQWDDVVSPRVTWDEGDLTRNLVRLIYRWLLDAESGRQQSTNPRAAGEEEEVPDKPFSGAVKASLASVVTFLEGDVNDRRITELIWGLLPLSTSTAFRGWIPLRSGGPATPVERPPIPWVYGITKLVASTDSNLGKVTGQSRGFHIPFPRTLLSTLSSDGITSIPKASDLAERRLSASGLPPRHRGVSSPGLTGRRCAAALAFPISRSDLWHIVRNVLSEDIQHNARGATEDDDSKMRRDAL